MPNCIACDQSISDNARICHICATPQKTFWRSLGRIVAIASAISVVGSALTVGVTFYPQARALFVPPRLELYQVEILPVPRRSTSEPERERWEFSVANKGRTDLFLTRIVIAPTGIAQDYIRGKNFVVNQEVKQGENHVVRLVVAKPDPRFQPLSQTAFDEFAETRGPLDGRRCMTFRVRPADLFGSEAPSEIRIANSEIDLQSTLLVSSISTGGDLDPQVQELAIKGIRVGLNRPGCID
ncbi:hypothetical protein [Dinoroseobacter sp. S375]|uniref:hypothetical protein n=1 Tax=Dinoroseobacter sp. S375 TaxID=3415136 RepID=UPI003C7C2C29